MARLADVIRRALGAGGGSGQTVTVADTTTVDLTLESDQITADAKGLRFGATDIAASTTAPTNGQYLSVSGGEIVGADAPEGGGGGSYTDEQARDAVGAMATNSASVTLTHDDGANTLTAAAIFGTTAGTVADGARGVTNGDTHDHSGGDGAQIAYSSLGGIPSTFAPAAHDHASNKLAQSNTHESPDTDSGAAALHHTLGFGEFQSAPGRAVVPLSVSGLTVTMGAWSFGGMNFAAQTLTLPAQARFGSVLTQEVYVGVSLLDGTLIFLPRLGHSGWIPLARCVVSGASSYTVTAIPPELPGTSLSQVHNKLRAGTALTQVFIGSSLLANGQGSGNLEGWLKTSARYGMNAWSSTITTENASHGGMGPLYHFGILAGRTAELNASGGTHAAASNVAVLLRGDHAARSGRPNAGRYSTAHQKAKTGLLWLEVSANGGTDYALYQEGCLRFAVNHDIPVVLVLGNAMGATIDAQAANALWTDAPRLIRLAQSLGVPVADAGAFMTAGMLQSADDAAGIAALYSDSGTHPSSAGGLSTGYAVTSGYDRYAHAMASVARPAVPLPTQATRKNEYVSNPNVPLACTVFTGAAIQTAAGAVTRATPVRDISAAPHHVLNQFGEVNSVQIPASGVVAVGVPFCSTAHTVWQGGAQDSTITLAPSAATVTIETSEVITDFTEAWTLARLSNPATISSRSLKLTNGAEGTAHLCAIFVYQPAHAYLPFEKFGDGTWETSILDGGLQSTRTNSLGAGVIIRHPACIGLYIQSYTGTRTANGVLTQRYDGIAAADITLLSSGGYAGVVRGQKFTSFGAHEMALEVKTVASGGGGSEALGIPTDVAGCFAILSG